MLGDSPAAEHDTRTVTQATPMALRAVMETHLSSIWHKAEYAVDLEATRDDHRDRDCAAEQGDAQRAVAEHSGCHADRPQPETMMRVNWGRQSKAFAPTPRQRSKVGAGHGDHARRPALGGHSACRGPVNCDRDNPLPRSATGIIPDFESLRNAPGLSCLPRRSRGQTAGLSLQQIHSTTPLLVSGLVSRLAST